MLLILSIFQTPLSVTASDQLCFTKPVAQSILVELKFSQVSSEKLNICQESYNTCTELNTNKDILIEGLKLDKIDLMKLSDEYKNNYMKTNQALLKSESSKPSRVTWVATGIVSTLILGLITAIAIK